MTQPLDVTCTMKDETARQRQDDRAATRVSPSASVRRHTSQTQSPMAAMRSRVARCTARPSWHNPGCILKIFLVAEQRHYCEVYLSRTETSR